MKNKKPLKKYWLVFGLSVFLGFMGCVLVVKTITLLKTNIYFTIGVVIILILIMSFLGGYKIKLGKINTEALTIKQTDPFPFR